MKNIKFLLLCLFITISINKSSSQQLNCSQQAWATYNTTKFYAQQLVIYSNTVTALALEICCATVVACPVCLIGAQLEFVGSLGIYMLAVNQAHDELLIDLASCPPGETLGDNNGGGGSECTQCWCDPSYCLDTFPEDNETYWGEILDTFEIFSTNGNGPYDCSDYINDWNIYGYHDECGDWFPWD